MSKAKHETNHRLRMRTLGYQDGLKGYPSRHFSDATYMTSYRRGRERAAEMKEKE